MPCRVYFALRRQEDKSRYSFVFKAHPKLIMLFSYSLLSLLIKHAMILNILRRYQLSPLGKKSGKFFTSPNSSRRSESGPQAPGSRGFLLDPGPGAGRERGAGRFYPDFYEKLRPFARKYN